MCGRRDLSFVELLLVVRVRLELLLLEARKRAPREMCEGRMMEWKGEKVYLGDGLYLHYDGYHFVLSAENGIVATNVVYLEPAVYNAFVQRVESFRKQKAVSPGDEPK